MKTSLKLLCISSVSTLLLTGCALTADPVQNIEQSDTISEQKQAQAAQQVAVKPTLKRKIALGRITNETQYGRSLLRDNHGDAVGKQLTDMMSKALVESGQFIVLERPDLSRLVSENNFAGTSIQKIGADVLLIGSLTEFGRKTDGKSGFVSKTKRQAAVAKMDVRLVDTSTGRIIFATSGAGEATNESGNVFGYGGRATYDGTLNDKAIKHAASEVVSNIISELADQPWKTYFISATKDMLIIAGGKHQGISVGDQFIVKTQGRKVKNPQTGFTITLPGKEIAKIEVVSLFGNDEVDEGSVCVIKSGSIKGYDYRKLIVFEE